MYNKKNIINEIYEIANKNKISKEEFNDILASALIGTTEQEFKLKIQNKYLKISSLQEKEKENNREEKIEILYKKTLEMLNNSESLTRLCRFAGLRMVRFSNDIESDINWLIIRLMGMFSYKLGFHISEEKVELFTEEQQIELKKSSRRVLETAIQFNKERISKLSQEQISEILSSGI